MRHLPARTCIGCRHVGTAAALVRLVAPAGRVEVAARRGGRAMPRQGRGAWLHPRTECIAAAVKARAFARAFRGSVDVRDAAQLLADLRVAIGSSFHEQGDSP